MPRVSVIMAVYNDAQFLDDAIESIRAQTFDDFEYIIVDDGSTDNTSAILRACAAQDARIRVITVPHSGLTNALNIGIHASTGEIIARMDADDISHPQRFEKQLSFLDAHETAGLCGAQGRYISESNIVLGNKDLPRENAQIKKKLLFNNQFIHSSWMVRREVLTAVGAYNERFPKSQDYELALRIARRYDVANLPERLIDWRVRKSSISWSGKAQEWHAIRARWYAITRYGYPVLEGFMHILLRLLRLGIPQQWKIKKYATQSHYPHGE